MRKLNGGFLALPRFWKRIISIAVDMSFCALAVWLAYYLRLGYFVSLAGRPSLAVIASIGLAIPFFIVSGLYRAVLRYAREDVLWSSLRAATSYGAIYASIFAGYGIEGVPRTVGIIQPVLLFAMVYLSRAGASYWLGGAYRRLIRPTPERHALIYGAGLSGQQLAAAIADAGSMNVVGFLDDDRSLQGQNIGGLRVYSVTKLGWLLANKSVATVLLAIPSATRARRHQIINELREYNLDVRTLPGVIDLASGQVRVDDLRPLSIEDLLRRSPVPPMEALVTRKIAEKTVLVTGAGGSIGSELCRQILALKPSRLLLVEANEFALYSISRELMQKAEQTCQVLPLLASVTDKDRMHDIFRTWRPCQVFHAAAFKHVPIVEHNVCEGVRNNVIGTIVAAQCALEHDAENFVLVSTDKAVRPTNVMGASKRLSEMVLQSLSERTDSTRFAMVRFGNVLGSSGSVVPVFREQIRRGGPVTVTDPEMTRFFMTIPEAAQLVVQAGAMAVGGEVFVLDMGEPVKIVDLAKSMIELSGRTIRDATNPEGDIEIQFVGTRPGEKLYEELLIGEDPKSTPHPRIFMARENTIQHADLEVCLENLRAHIAAQDARAVRELLMTVVEGFTPSDELVDLITVADGHENHGKSCHERHSKHLAGLL